MNVITRGAAMAFLLPALLCIPAFAEPDAGATYATHKGVRIFTNEPCTTSLDLIDSDGPPVAEPVERHVYGDAHAAERLGQWQASQAMAWGFVLGFDTAMGGLDIGEKTTLSRYRTACRADPEQSGINVLLGLVVQAELHKQFSR